MIYSSSTSLLFFFIFFSSLPISFYIHISFTFPFLYNFKCQFRSLFKYFYDLVFDLSLCIGYFCLFLSHHKNKNTTIKMKKACVLCKQPARIHCESDQASLCWDCDAKVHSANFLVARHSRNLLCRVCQSPTPWSAAGSKLEPTYSSCRKCADRTICDGSDREDEQKAVKEEEEIAEIHEVPWSPPPPPESSQSGGEAAVSRKRCRRGNDRPIIDDLNICTPQSQAAAEVASVANSAPRGIIATPPRKIRRSDGGEVEVRVSKSPIVEAVRRFRREEAVAGEEMLEYRNLSGGAGAVDLNLTLTLGMFSR